MKLSDTRHQPHMQRKVFLGMNPPEYPEMKKDVDSTTPFFDYRHSVGRTYPWQVAPQQSLLPFRFNNTKFISANYIYNLSKFPATFRPSKRMKFTVTSK
jgi:hypothetical protein